MTWTRDALGRVLAALEAQGCRPEALGDGTSWLADCPGCGERALIVMREGFAHVGEEAPEPHEDAGRPGPTPRPAQGATWPEERSNGGTGGEHGT